MEICRDCNSLDQTQKKQSEDVLPSSAHLFVIYTEKTKFLVTDTTTMGKAFETVWHNTPFQKLQDPHVGTNRVLCFMIPNAVEDFKTLKAIKNTTQNSPHLMPQTLFNLFYCLKGGKGMFLTVCETRSSAINANGNSVARAYIKMCLPVHTQFEIYLLS